MPVSVTIEATGLDELVRKLAAGAKPIIRGLTRGVGEEIKSELARYPGPVSKPFQFASPASAQAYRAQRRMAGLGPYRRGSDPFSQRLGASWTTENQGEVDAVVGTRVDYAHYVQDHERQIPGHRNTGWVTDKEAGKKVEESRAIERILDEIIRHW